MLRVGPSLLAGFLALQNALALPSRGSLEKRDLDSWVATESSYAFTRLLCNIGSDGCNAAGVASGLVVASPSTSNPNCDYIQATSGESL